MGVLANTPNNKKNGSRFVSELLYSLIMMRVIYIYKGDPYAIFKAILN
jgi:hypothetical protein